VGRFVYGREQLSELGRPSTGGHERELTLFCAAGFKKNVNRATTTVMMKTGELGLPGFEHGLVTKD
jgi:hypothetical protein